MKPRRLFLEKASVFDGRTNRAIIHENLIETYEFSTKTKESRKEA